MLLELAIPSATAMLVDAGTGFGLAVVVVKVLSPPRYIGCAHRANLLPYHRRVSPCPTLVVLITQPLIGRITKPDNVRFEYELDFTINLAIYQDPVDVPVGYSGVISIS